MKEFMNVAVTVEPTERKTQTVEVTVIGHITTPAGRAAVKKVQALDRALAHKERRGEGGNHEVTIE